MRKWFVIFMLFLLPLRALVGDAMAYSMPVDAMNTVSVQAVFTASSSVVAGNSIAEPTLSYPCHTQEAAADDTTPAQNQCTTCQDCHLSGGPLVQLTCGLLHTITPAPAQHTAQWHSADPRLQAKTPIF